MCSIISLTPDELLLISQPSVGIISPGQNNEPSPDNLSVLSSQSSLSLQTPVEAAYPGLRSPEAPVSPPSVLRPASATPSPASAASLRQTPELSSPDQNSNSVRDLENAMSKHLPKDKISEASVSEAATSALLRQFYTGRTTLEAAHPGSGDPAVLRGGYSGLGPAQPLPLKPSLYLDTQYPPDQASGLYPGQPLPGAGLHSLYNRGQSWYPGS